MNNVVYFKQPKKIWTLRIKLFGADPEWARVMEIDWRASFLDLHEPIQEAVDGEIGYFRSIKPGTRTNKHNPAFFIPGSLRQGGRTPNSTRTMRTGKNSLVGYGLGEKLPRCKAQEYLRPEQPGRL
ncbi:hypothetical protein DO021_05210 [Desulfobacter hydrogenophilus]|uniref:Uncharacterized protein n=1 Tax=Desulfobacter hydrogenophilus TaxID=2291 RepID=A0A328FEB9_9BACT|nr:hypothetical protein [Desulfobacter hydrogenophilus]NDY70976.1 hypothetical protein [Desulfobacter hydrogenophilus]QBH12784.1 hypothetical protein EYB58_07595 [Desulfobacter hydrogenophilus]RAM03021.1 hypothetical protein DO021_05210 [Desulfobacter hydrogenophilus]